MALEIRFRIIDLALGRGEVHRGVVREHGGALGDDVVRGSSRRPGSARRCRRGGARRAAASLPSSSRRRMTRAVRVHELEERHQDLVEQLIEVALEADVARQLPREAEALVVDAQLLRVVLRSDRRGRSPSSARRSACRSRAPSRARRRACRRSSAAAAPARRKRQAGRSCRAGPAAAHSPAARVAAAAPGRGRCWLCAGHAHRAAGPIGRIGAGVPGSGRAARHAHAHAADGGGTLGPFCQALRLLLPAAAAAGGIGA